jgi:hypothetical protein
MSASKRQVQQALASFARSNKLAGKEVVLNVDSSSGVLALKLKEGVHFTA